MTHRLVGTDLVTRHIDTVDAKPVGNRPYRQSLAMMKEMKVKEMEEDALRKNSILRGFSRVY